MHKSMPIIDKTQSSKLKTQMKHGFSWNIANLILNKGLSVVVRLILARVLTPDQFGLFAMVTVALSLISILLDFGLQNTLIQKQRDRFTAIRMHTSFWFVMLAGLVWFLLFVVVGIPLLQHYYHEARLVPIAMWMSLSIPLSAMSLIPIVQLTRRMQFKKMVHAELVSLIISSIASIFFALNGYGVWSLVIGHLLAVMLSNLMLWQQVKWRPRQQFSLPILKNLLAYSLHLLGSKIIFFFRTNVDNLTIGALLGTTSLGLYALAYLYSEGIRQQVAAVIDKIMFPVYSKLQHDQVQLKLSYLNVAKRMSLAMFPFSLCVMLFAEPIVNFVFGKQWHEAALLMPILMLNSMLFAISGPSAEMMQAIGKAKQLLKIALVNLILIAIPSMCLFVYLWGMQGAAYAFTLAFFCQRSLTTFQSMQSLNIKMEELLKAIAPACLLAFFISFMHYLWQGFLNGPYSIAIFMSLIFMLYAIVFKSAFREHPIT